MNYLWDVPLSIYLFPLLRHKFPNLPPAADDIKSEAMLPYPAVHRSDQNCNLIEYLADG
jgi:hypothetical protein